MFPLSPFTPWPTASYAFFLSSFFQLLLVFVLFFFSFRDCELSYSLFPSTFSCSSSRFSFSTGCFFSCCCSSWLFFLFLHFLLLQFFLLLPSLHVFGKHVLNNVKVYLFIILTVYLTLRSCTSVAAFEFHQEPENKKPFPAKGLFWSLRTRKVTLKERC